MPHPALPLETADRIAALADQCVMCGLCLPHCPTYHVGRNEAESPRGRIALAKQIAQHPETASASTLLHLDQCLSCMSCESACPSGVHYGELLEHTRSLTRRLAPMSWSRRWLTAARLRVGLRFAGLPGVRTLMRSRFAQTLLRPVALDRPAREVPLLPRARPRRESLQPTGAARDRIGLLLGCIGELADADVHTATIRLLRALGYEVVLPARGACCGALARHAGDIANGEASASATLAQFSEHGVGKVLVSASGCFGSLRDTANAQSGARAIRVRDVHDFIASDERAGDLRFRPLARRAALHTPCTQANVVRAGDAIRQLLAKIPQLEIIALPVSPRCCGSAGDYFLAHPQIADALRAEKVAQIQAIAADLLLTSNVGCRIFIGNGLNDRGDPLRVCHPITLLAEQLEESH